MRKVAEATPYFRNQVVLGGYALPIKTLQTPLISFARLTHTQYVFGSTTLNW